MHCHRNPKVHCHHNPVIRSDVPSLLDPAQGDGLTATGAVRQRASDTAAFLETAEEYTLAMVPHRAETVGRPRGHGMSTAIMPQAAKAGPRNRSEQVGARPSGPRVRFPSRRPA